MEVVAVTAAEELADGHGSCLAENIPTRDVDAALDVGMAFEGGVHFAIEPGELARIFPEQMRTEFAQTGAHSLRVSRQIKRPERAHFSVTDEARVRLDADNCAVEDGDRFAAGPFVGGLMER